MNHIPTTGAGAKPMTDEAREAERGDAWTPARLLLLWKTTGGKAWEPPDLRHPGVTSLIEGGWTKRCVMRFGVEAFDSGLDWTEAARAYFAAIERGNHRSDRDG